ncbi:MAG: HEAT repeat domain-containing protein [Planctomycetes bacterium]|nr:HEAT repeat domain-containing protein [Planctomycetota bacterium]
MASPQRSRARRIATRTRSAWIGRWGVTIGGLILISGVEVTLLVGRSPGQEDRGSGSPSPSDGKGAEVDGSSAEPAEDPATVRARLEKIIAAADPEGWRAIVTILGHPDPRLRRQAVEGLRQAYPERVFEILASLQSDENPHRREAAQFGIGMLTDEPRAFDVLVRGLEDVGGPSRAVFGGLQIYLGPSASAVDGKVLGQRSDPVPGLDRIARIRDALHGRLDPRPTSEESRDLVDDFLYRLADHETVERRWALLGERERRALKSFTLATRGWAGRPPLPDEASRRYDFEMTNYAIDPPKTKTFSIEVDGPESELLQYRHGMSFVHRGFQLVLPIDALSVEPDRCDLVVESPSGDAGEETASGAATTIRYRIPARRTLEVGMGAMNTSYWIAKLVGPLESRLSLDPDGRPASEELFRDGQRIARYVYSDYTDDPGHPVSPRRIQIDIDQAANVPNKKLRYDLRFHWVDGAWVLERGRAEERLPDPADGERVALRATAELRDIHVTPR